MYDIDQHVALRDLDPLVQSRLVVAVEDGHRDLRDHRPGVDARIDEVRGRAGDLDAVVEGVSHGVGARKRRKQRRMGVDDAGEPVQERRPEDVHEAGRNDEVRFVPGDRLGHRLVPRRPGRVVRDAHHEAGDACPVRPCQTLYARPGGADRHDGRPVIRVGAGVEQRREVGAGAGDEDHEPRGQV